MRRILSFLTILLLAGFCSACVNNFAVHELNQMAAQYVQKGDLDSAISRLESSVELDDNIYETRYNLAVAYLKAEKYEKALESINKAIELAAKSDAKDAYYTAGVINDTIAENLSIEDNEKYVSYLKSANDNFEKYLELSKDNEDDEFETIKNRIEENFEKIKEKEAGLE